MYLILNITIATTCQIQLIQPTKFVRTQVCAQVSGTQVLCQLLRGNWHSGKTA